ncbi:cytochrome P450 [Embleya sp. NBC_00896]|uniref:cytochrome P450 n=1 Tax=Embleya sp. NBC_00896 TaxID=2975961 RepID=UPI002F90E3D9|nr:cytochrome P450 [Embleya sp. NBC_00896]
MSRSETVERARVTVFSSKIEELLRDRRGAKVFRLDADTVGVADPDLIDNLLGSRRAHEFERPTFKPLQGRSIDRAEAADVLHAVSRDVRAALSGPAPDAVDLSGIWPRAGHAYLRDLLFGPDPLRFRVLTDRRLERTPALARAAIRTSAVLPGKRDPDASMSQLAALTVTAAEDHGDRRYAMGLYRRVAAPVCLGVSALVANALWLGSPFGADASNRHIVLESLRLLPPSWNILRVASPEFPALDSRIGPNDDVLLFPLLTHRDPDLWDDPDEFRPERWNDLDADNHSAYFPFGHANERCRGRHMIVPLAEHLLDRIRSEHLAVSPHQTIAKVPLAGLLGVSRVRVSRTRVT